MGVNASEMVNGTEYDLGNGFTIRPWDLDGVRLGYFVTGPAGPECKAPYLGRCGGLVPTRNLEAQGYDRPVWEVASSDPLSLSPSIQCPCDAQHGHVTDGVWR